MFALGAMWDLPAKFADVFPLQSFPRKVHTLQLHDYLRILRRSWILLLSLACLGLLAGGLASLATQPVYKAETELFVSTPSSQSFQELQMSNAFILDRAHSYVLIARTPAVLQPVIDDLGLSVSAGQLAAQIEAEVEPNTVLIVLKTSAGSPDEATAIASSAAKSLISVVHDLEGRTESGDPRVQLSVVMPAAASSVPAAPDTALFLGLGLLAGVALGLAAAFGRNALDTRIRGQRDLRAVTTAPLLGGITFNPEAAKKPLITQIPAQSPRAESYRQIRTNLQFVQAERMSSLLVTSSVPGEGKTTTAVNLALTLAQSGRSVVLVDADLRRPMIAQHLGLDPEAGLTTALVNEAGVDDLLQPWGSHGLQVLTSGQLPPNPSELLGSASMDQVLARLRAAFDVVILDAPPLRSVTDAAVLARHSDGVVLVVGSRKVRAADLEEALSTLSMVAAKLVGVVLNRLPERGPDGHKYGAYDLGRKQPGPRRRGRAVPAAAAGSGKLSARDSGSAEELRPAGQTAGR
jgi:capsular exopolysaccharide synthesis family protein